MVRIAYLIAGMIIGASLALCIMFSILGNMADKANEHHRVHVPLAWEGITDNQTLGV